LIDFDHITIYPDPNSNRLDDRTQRLLTLFLGFTGVHRFRRKQYRSSIGYLLTFGLCGIGWVVDAICASSTKFNAVRVATVRRLNYRVAKLLCYTPLGILGLHRYYLSLGRQMFVSIGILLVHIVGFCLCLLLDSPEYFLQWSVNWLLVFPWGISFMIWMTDLILFESLWETAEKDYQERLSKSEGNARDMLQMGIEGREWELKDEDLIKQHALGSGATSIVYYGTLKVSQVLY